MPKIKGYWGMFKNMDWGDIIHGETATEAKKRFYSVWHTEGGEYIDVRVYREKHFDDIPITRQTVNDYRGEEWHTICDCELCKEEVVDD